MIEATFGQTYDNEFVEQQKAYQLERSLEAFF